MKKKKVTVTREYIDKLKSDLEYEKKKRSEAESDREKFRDFFLKLLKDNVLITAKGEYFSPSVMIEKLSKLMNNVEPWYWG